MFDPGAIVPLAGLAAGFLLYVAGREKLGMLVAFVAGLAFFIQYAGYVAPIPFLPRIPAQGGGGP